MKGTQVAAITLTAAVLAGCGAAEAHPNSATPISVTTAVTKAADPKPTTAKQWNRTFTRQHPAGTWAGGDVNVSATSRNGDIWWFYGDTLLQPSAGTYEWAESTALTFPRGTSKGRTVTYLNEAGDTTRTLLPADRTHKQWPSATTPSPTGPDHIILSASDIAITNDTLWGFRMVGATLYDLKLTGGPTPTTTIINTVATPQPSTAAPIQWGSALTRDGRNLYIYGSQEVVGQFGKNIYLVTAPLATWTDTTTWRYQTGGSATVNINNAEPIIPAAKGMPHTFTVTPHPNSDGWLLIAKQNEGIGQHIIAATAKKPQGPWGTPQTILNAAPQDDVWQYMAIAHPDIPTVDGSLLISRSQNVIAGDGLQQIVRNPVLYRPQFYTVPTSDLPGVK